MKKAMYPGSFDPLTLGHMDIIERAAVLFDHLVIGIGVNTDKTSFMSIEQREVLLKECTNHLKNVVVTSFGGLLVDFAKSESCTVIVRGLRAVSDFEYEFRVSMANRKLAPDIETIFLITRDEYSFLSSSVVREIARLGGKIDQFVPEAVVNAIENQH